MNNENSDQNHPSPFAMSDEKLLPEHGTPDRIEPTATTPIINQPTPPAPIVSPPTHVQNTSALNIVLQWLTYVFWFWTLASLATVLSGVLIHILINNSKDSSWIIYAATPLVVLLPLAALTDKYYKKVEPKQKHGFAAVIMVVNAVIAALGAVGSVIGILYAILDLVLSTDGNTTGNAIAAVVCIITASLSALFFVRVLYIDKLRVIRVRFTTIVCGVTLIALILTVLFPLVNEIKRKGDRLVEDNYALITSKIQAYVTENRKVPQSLDDITFEDGAKRAIDSGKITYKPLEGTSSSPIPAIGLASSSLDRKYSYELCVDWQYESKSEYEDYSYYSSRKNFSEYYGHKAGKECYTETPYAPY